MADPCDEQLGSSPKDGQRTSGQQSQSSEIGSQGSQTIDSQENDRRDALGEDGTDTISS